VALGGVSMRSPGGGPILHAGGGGVVEEGNMVHALRGLVVLWLSGFFCFRLLYVVWVRPVRKKKKLDEGKKGRKERTVDKNKERLGRRKDGKKKWREGEKVERGAKEGQWTHSRCV
jgi:hypothetical protein